MSRHKEYFFRLFLYFMKNLDKKKQCKIMKLFLPKNSFSFENLQFYAIFNELYLNIICKKTRESKNFFAAQTKDHQP